jgi:tetratricopeptide (TPR) repeat protein
MLVVHAWGLRADKPRCLAAVVIAVAALTIACSPAATTARIDPARLLEEARAEGLPADDPLALDAEIKESVDAYVRASASTRERLRLVQDYLGSRIGFQYAPSRSLTARDAWRERRGDCVSYTSLFVALARHVGLRAYFVHVREVHEYYERAGRFFVSSHVAVGHGSGPEARVIDLSKDLSLWREMGDWRLAAYRSIDDVDAVALYYSNIAVDWMLAGRIEDAERLLRFWRARAPRMVELHNNLGVALNRRGRHAEALAVLQGGIEAFPTFKPLYTNAILAARGARRIDVADALGRRGHELEHDDPFFLFARALNLFHSRAYGEAARELKRARSAAPESSVILAWLIRAYLLSGLREEGLEAFGEMRRLDPGGRLVRDLAAQFPELGGRN